MRRGAIAAVAVTLGFSACSPKNDTATQVKGVVVEQSTTTTTRAPMNNQQLTDSLFLTADVIAELRSRISALEQKVSDMQSDID